MRDIKFSKVFPGKHPRVGQPTFFYEKIINSLRRTLEFGVPEKEPVFKFHTIRAGQRFKVGDMFQPRQWSGLPYRSKPEDICRPLEIKKIFNFQALDMDLGVTFYLNGELLKIDTAKELAKNDGLKYEDFLNWFTIHPKNASNHFAGQIICWSEIISY